MSDITNNETTPALLEHQSYLWSSELTSDNQPSNVSDPSVLTKLANPLGR